MRAGDVSSGAAQLAKAAERLEAAWLETREHWSDANSLAFEQTELMPLMHAVKLTIESTQLYGSVVRKAQNACNADARD